MTTSHKADWLIPSGLIGLALVPALAGSVRLAELTGGSELTIENARFFAARGWMVLHIVTALLFSLIGAFQFSPGVRRRSPSWHRAAGWSLIPCGILSAGSGMWLAHLRGVGTFTGTAPGDYDNDVLYVVRLVVGLAMLTALGLATIAIRRRQIPRHRAWMMRAYALGLGAGTQALTHLPWFLTARVHNDTARTLFMAAGWAINAVVAEWLIARRPRTASPASADRAPLRV